MPNNYLSMLYKHIIQVENKNVGLKVGGGGTNILLLPPNQKSVGHMPPLPPTPHPTPLPTPVIYIYAHIHTHIHTHIHLYIHTMYTWLLFLFCLFFVVLFCICFWGGICLFKCKNNSPMHSFNDAVNTFFINGYICVRTISLEQIIRAKDPKRTTLHACV